MPQTAIVYTVINQTVATVDDAGLIEARVPGNTTVTGKVCYMYIILLLTSCDSLVCFTSVSM